MKVKTMTYFDQVRGRASWLKRLVALVLIGFGCSGLSQAQVLFQEAIDISPEELERVYTKGLQFLQKNQAEDGSWADRPYGSEPAAVGLALVSMLAHGDDPNFGPYASSIRKGLDFILKARNAQTGYIGKTMYNHGFSTLALAEAYGTVQDVRLGPALVGAIKLIVQSQAKNPQGAWRYSPESQDADTTVSGAQMVALFAARNAGIAVPEEAIQKGLKYFARCQTTDGGFGYTTSIGPNGTRTAIACLVYALAKEKNNPVFEKGFKYLQKAPPEIGYQQYYLYYAAQAFFHASPAAWRDWNRKNLKTLAASQGPDGHWEGQFGSSFSTSASLLSLALNYRFLPIYER